MVDIDKAIKGLDMIVDDAIKVDLEKVEERVLAHTAAEVRQEMEQNTKPKKGATMARFWANANNIMSGRDADPVFRGVDNREGGTLWEDNQGLFLRYPQQRRVGNQYRNDPVEWRLHTVVKPRACAQFMEMVVWQRQQLPLIVIFRAPNGELLRRHMTMAA